MIIQFKKEFLQDTVNNMLLEIDEKLCDYLEKCTKRYVIIVRDGYLHLEINQAL